MVFLHRFQNLARNINAACRCVRERVRDAATIADDVETLVRRFEVLVERDLHVVELDLHAVEERVVVRRAGGDLVEGADVNPQYLHATDLIRHISDFGGFDIAAACYPEGHPDSDGVESEIKYMKMKEDFGATHFISQLFFDNEDFYYMVDLARRAGVKAPIQAGVMPVVNVRQIQRMVSTCGAKLPRKFTKIMARYGSNPEARVDAGISEAIEQIIDLLASGVEGVHVYAMNNTEVSRRIYDAVVNML